MPANAVRNANSRSGLLRKVFEFIPDNVILTKDVLIAVFVGRGVGSNVGFVGIPILDVSNGVGCTVGSADGKGVGLLMGVDGL